MDKVTLDTINLGAAVELFAEEMEKVLANIADPNVPTDAMREITLTVKIKPSKDGTSAQTTVQAKSKLANIDAHEHFMMLGLNSGSVEAYVSDPRQTDLGLDDNVRDITGGNV